MKNFISLIFLMAIGLSSAWAQFDLVDDNPPCIEDGGNLNYNVLSNDLLPAGMNIIVVTLESDPCFYIDEQGTVHTNPNSGVDCCGDHHLVYSIIDPELGATIEPAILNICVECAKPDCALINLEDYLGNTGDGTTPGEGGCIHVCENSVSTLFVPYNSNNLYAWQVLAGGTGVIGANPAEYIVTWGAAGLGIVKLDITDANGTTSFTFCFDIMEAPNTSFTGPVYICLGQNACFTNTTPDGDVYFWDFGDGGTSNLENPCYEYANPGTYTVTLCASNYNYDENGNQLCCCTSCVSMEIVVDPLPGPSIYCISTLCEGDEACYTTDATNCSSYLWTVLDADGNPTVPFTGQGTNQICVTWGAGPFGTITLDVSGCDDAYCNNPSTAVVPIISTLGIIDGPTTVCEGSTETYSLPKWMSVLYDWTVIGGTILNGDSTHIVTIEWGSQGVGTIHVDYCSEFLEGLPGHDAPECCGSADLTVNILPVFNVSHSGPSNVCVGTTSYFSATSFPYNSYSWTVSPSVPFTVLAPDQISITWTSGMAGTYTITATPNAPGQYCNTSDAIVVTVLEVPPADDIDGPLQVCENDIYYYTAVSSTPGVSFSWVATNGIPATGSGTTIGIAWGNGGGTLTLYQVMTSPPFCNSDPISITVTEKQLGGPFTIAGSANCTNTLESYVLSPAPHPDATIFWYVTPAAAGSIVGGQGTLNPQVQWNNTPGGVSLNVDFTLCNQVTTINQPLNLVSPQVPVIVQNGNICPGGGGTLDATLGFSSYQWSTGNNTPSTPVTAGGLYSLITVDNNNCTATTYFTANATPGPLASVSSGDAPVICITNPHTVTMVAPFNLNYSVEWFCNSVSVAGPGPVYSYQHVFQNTPGIYVYHIVVTDITTGCISTSLPFVVEESTCPPPPGCTPDPCALFPTAVNQTPYCNVVDFGFTPCPNFTFSSWSFGDLTTSGSPNPSHQYTQAGCYNATVCGSVPGTDPITHLPCVAGYCEDISVCVPIAAEFDWTTGVCSNMQFTDMSTIIVGPGNAISSWNWTFCDINNVVVGTSSTQNPSFNFPGPGTYIVKLEVCNSNGCCAQISHNIVVGGVGTPVITINPTPACAGTPLFYSVTATNAVSYFWDFGDGATFTGQNPQHTYTSGNTYLVTVVATDPNGC
ncbi:MAG: PKD domain-containing protein, partial [Flavobacteriales bacterium]|nr:PKD domain-containing protein [Flavobacteriales bacterium]